MIYILASKIVVGFSFTHFFCVFASALGPNDNSILDTLIGYSCI